MSGSEQPRGEAAPASAVVLDGDGRPAVDELRGRLEALREGFRRRTDADASDADALRADARRAGFPGIAIEVDIILASREATAGSIPEAISRLNAARQAAHEEHADEAEIAALQALGVAWGMLGDAARARALFLVGLERAREIGHRRWEAIQLASYAFTWGEAGTADAYVEHTQPSVELFRELGDTARLPQALVNLSGGLVRLMRLDEARAALDEASELERNTPSPRIRAFILAGRGEIASAEGRIEEALELYERSRQVMLDAGYPFDAMRRAQLVMHALQRHGRHAEAVEVGEQAVADCRSQPWTSVCSHLLESLSLSRAAIGQYQAAWRALREAVSLRDAIAADGQREEARMIDELDRARFARDMAAARRADQTALLESHRELRAALARERSLRASIEVQVVTDALTGVCNRRGFEHQAPAVLQDCAEHGWPVAAIVLDLDRFKQVNDTWGHAAGDEALKTAAARCTSELREGDLLARVGGEEFVALLPHASAEQALAIAERLLNAVRSEPVAIGVDQDLTLSVSIGLAVAHEGEPLASLLERADRAMYAAKAAGRDRVVAFDDIDHIAP